MLLTLWTAGVHASVDQARIGGLKYLIQSQNGDGRWSSAQGDLDVQATANALQALRHGGLQKSPAYASGLAWLANAGAQSTDAQARKAAALAEGGLGSAAQLQVNNLFSLRAAPDMAVWGSYDGHTVSNFDTALGLSALRSADLGYPSKLNGPVREAVCSLLLNRLTPATNQVAWPMAPSVPGQAASAVRPSILATAQIVDELQRYSARVIDVPCGDANYNVPTEVSRAVAWLRLQQNASDAGFGEIRRNGTRGPSSVFVSALVYRAFAGLTTPPQPATTNLMNYLLGQQDSDGSWRGDAFITTQAVLALSPAIGDQVVDTDKDGVPDVIEQALGRNAFVADAAGSLAAPSQAEQGVTVTSFAVQGVVGTAFSYFIENSTTPVSIVSGALPPGISLDSISGELAGTPTRSGSWSFEFQREVASEQQTIIGRIDVASAETADSIDGDVPLPGWALVALAGGLLGAIHRRARR